MEIVVLPGGSSDSATKGQILNSELWTTIFRGGYATERLQRSISGKVVSILRTCLSFLLNL